MSIGVKILIVFVGVFMIVGGGCAATIVGTNNDLVMQEQGIKAQYDQNKNNYDNMWKKFREVSQVPTAYTKDLKEVYDSAIKSRYGKNGSQAMFQWLKEHNPQFDSSMYKQVQVVVESGRNAFESNQTMLIDKKRVYETKIKQFPTNIIAKYLNFPTIDLDKFDIVTSETTEQTFDTKQADEIQLR